MPAGNAIPSPEPSSVPPPPAQPSLGVAPPAQGLTAAQWSLRLRAKLDAPVEVRYGRARRSVVRASLRGGVHVVHLSAMFAHAPLAVQDALGAWLRSGRRASRACAVLDGWIDEQVARLAPPPARDTPLRARGLHHDLSAMVHELLVTEFVEDFSSRPAPQVGWGRAGRSRSKRSLRLGSFDFLAQRVRVHPVLDQAAVPAYFVRFVLFHELLHAALGEDTTADGRRSHHGRAFRERERRYADYEPSIAWERVAIRALIRSARSGEALTLEGRRERRGGVRAPEVMRGATRPAETGTPVRWAQHLMFECRSIPLRPLARRRVLHELRAGRGSGSAPRA